MTDAPSRSAAAAPTSSAQAPASTAGSASEGTWDRPRRRTGALGWIRTLLAFVLALCAGAAAVAAVTMTWLQESVVDREGFAALSEELVLDQELSDEIAAAASESAGEAVQDVDTRGIPFANILLDGVEGFVTTTIQDYVGSEEYAEDWYSVLGETYQANIASSRDGAGAPEDLQVSVGPLVDRVEQRLEDRIPLDLDLDLRSQEALGGRDAVLSLDDSATGPAIDTMVEVADQAPYWWAGSALAALAALLLARRREWPVLGLGLGLLGATIAVGRAADGISRDILASPGLSDLAHSVVERVVVLLGGGLDGALMPWLWVGVILSIAGLVLIALRALLRPGRQDSEAKGPLAGEHRDSQAGPQVYDG